jgi:hypothetical protein
MVGERLSITYESPQLDYEIQTSEPVITAEQVAPIAGELALILLVGPNMAAPAMPQGELLALEAAVVTVKTADKFQNS